MHQPLQQSSPENVSVEAPQVQQKITVLEALAEEITAVDLSRSNISTRVKDVDPDDA